MPGRSVKLKFSGTLDRILNIINQHSGGGFNATLMALVSIICHSINKRSQQINNQHLSQCS